MAKREKLSQDIYEQIKKDYRERKALSVGFDEDNLLRRVPERWEQQGWRSPFSVDIDRILHCPYFNRYADKTQVYSLFKNDDVTRRSLHVQLVSRIARTIGRALKLNLELIEAIALGHDIGHPAFAHAGESILDKLYYAHTGRHFLHNIHSVRVLDKMHHYNLSLATLDGIAAHNGELELAEYHPVPVKDFAEFDEMMEKCCLDKGYADKIMPSTLEGAVVRICDILAYLGKDREDAILTKAIQKEAFEVTELGESNEELVHNLIVNIIENSYGKPYIKMDDTHFDVLKRAKAENYAKVYNFAGAHTGIGNVIRPMIENVYNQLLSDLVNGCQSSPIFTHHIAQINKMNGNTEYTGEPNQIVVDYIASMTDDYFIELHDFLFKDSSLKVAYRGYFDD